MTNLRVLVVDDDDDMRRLVRLFAEREKVIDVTEAASASGGVDSWRSEHQDVVVLDLRMAGGTGLDAAREILAEEPDQPIIMFSAYMSDADIAEAERLGVRACVAKDEIRLLPSLILEHGRDR